MQKPAEENKLTDALTGVQYTYNMDLLVYTQVYKYTHLFQVYLPILQLQDTHKLNSKLELKSIFAHRIVKIFLLPDLYQQHLHLLKPMKLLVR